jgi:hypothetical protein
MAGEPHQHGGEPTEVGVDCVPGEEDCGPPPGEEHGPSEESQEFAVLLQDALFALEDLPGYRYTVTDPGMGLALTGTVGSPERRDWSVSVQGHPEQVVGRWALVDGRAYSDISGRWEKIARVPFDADSPISFAAGPMNQLTSMGGYGAPATLSRHDDEVNAHPATRHDLEYDLEGMRPPEKGPGPGGEPPEAKESVWIAKDGDYLLRYKGGSMEYGPYGAARTIEVTPLAARPRIQAPSVGTPAFKGSPPPWRAPVIAQHRLANLTSYGFESRSPNYMEENPSESDVRLEGQITSEQGRVSGKVPDMMGVSVSPSLNDAEIVYSGRRIWARLGSGQWRRVSAESLFSGPASPEGNAIQLLFAIPTGPPAGLLPAEEFGGGPMGEMSMFGLDVAGGGPMGPTYLGSPLADGKLVGTETVNGVRALHYKGMVPGFGPEGPGMAPDKQPAEVWLAVDGLYLVRARTGPGGGGGPGRSELDITAANKPVSIDVPAR